MPKEKFFDPRKPFQSQRPETHEEWQARMGGEVLAVVRSGLYLDFRFLDMALSALTPAPDERCRVLATDGQTLYYQPQRLLQLYQENPKYLNRLYLHTIFHCIFRHLWLKGRREPQLWSLACDIAVENVIDSLQRKSVTRPLTYVRQNAYRQITAEEKVVAAAPVYRWLTRQTPGVLRQLEREFVTDDHRLWPKDAPEQPQQMPTPLPQKTWQKIGERMQTELDLRDKEAGEGTDALKQQVKAANRSRRSYKDFLRRFCVLREEVKLDPDEFDLNFYTYGLSVYGNLPLIEPLESRESKKIEELALVIDTSYSTSGELVRAFLAETYTLLKGRENFFHRMNLHLIQADNAVRQDILIRNEDELIHAMNHFELRGGGGTDFRPAFAYVNQLCAEKKFSNLRGLLYFTDGMGTYPARRPGYDTAFLFLGERFDDANVPPWAMKVVLDEEEFTGAAARPASALADALAEEDDLYRELNDADNCCATVQLDNGAMGFMFTNRTHGAGCNVETEIIGTHGTLRIANVGAKNLLQIVDGSGAREEYYPDFLSRWHQAYINEIQEFVSCINEGRKPGVTVYDGTKVSQAAYRCKESFETGEMLVNE